MEILCFSSGFLICLVLSLIFYKVKQSGYLRIDTSDPDTDFYLMDISADLDKLKRKKSMVLKIDTKYKKPQ